LEKTATERDIAGKDAASNGAARVPDVLPVATA